MDNTMHWSVAVVVVAAVAGLPIESRGQTLFSTFGPAETFNTALPGPSVGAGVLGGFPVADGGIILAAAFTPSASGYLSRVDLGMEYKYDPVKASGPANLDVTIAADQAGLPGAAIETIHLTDALGSIANAMGIVSANSAIQPFLQAGVQYWVVVAPPDPRNTVFQWLLTAQPNVKGLSIDKGSNVPWQGRPAYETALAFGVYGIQSAGPEPAVGAGGVVDAASFRATISPDSWSSIFGTNLSARTRSWQASDFVGNALPLSLDGVAVLIGGYPAAVSYISPSQINVQVPDGAGPGMVTVQVITPAGPSGLAQVDAEQWAPNFFTFSSGATSYVAATYEDGTIAGKSGLFGSSVSTRPAKPGDVISLWGTGFGPTAPTVPVGVLFSGAAPLPASDQLAIAVGNVPATVLFAGLSEAGLYQFNVIVPEVPDGDQLVTAQVQGVSAQPALYLTIQQ
jgi:uncharacterized protein (TIGR03437 family)